MYKLFEFSRFGNFFRMDHNGEIIYADELSHQNQCYETGISLFFKKSLKFSDSDIRLTQRENP